MRLSRSFFERDVLQVAPELIGKTLIRFKNNELFYFTIAEVEAYGGIEDQASHARFGKTARNAMMFAGGGIIYVYLIYGVYWMLNIVTGTPDKPQAVLIRSLNEIEGPGRIARNLEIDKSFNGEDLSHSGRIWLEDNSNHVAFIQKPRYGIGYAEEPWKSLPWRFIQIGPPK
jgi:DNA-3-methyladenine glycosylase